MSVSVLLITHGGIGSNLIKVAQDTFGQLPLNVTQLSFQKQPHPEFLVAKASYLVELIDTGDGVLVLTDMFGSTPSNISQALQHRGYSVKVVAGVNVPMLFRIMNYPYLNLNALAKKAISGGKEGIFECFTEMDIAIRHEMREDNPTDQIQNIQF